MAEYKPGDVLCYTAFAGKQAAKMKVPTWALVTGDGEGIILSGDFDGGAIRRETMFGSSGDIRCSTCRRVVPPEEWPDDVCAAVAKLALLKEV